MSDERLYEIAGKNIEKWRMQMQHPELYRPIPTGLKELDRYIGGILEGAYYVLGGPHKSAKALSLDTPIMTPNGWSTMGRLQAGEYVFGTDGLAHKIILVTEPMNDHECYNVHFSNGDDIIADAGHLWNVRYLKHKRTKDNQHNKVFVTETMTTAQLSAHAILSHGKLGKLNKYSIRLSSAPRSDYVHIVSVEPTSSVPVKCIMVDSPDHLYLAGKSMIPTHNTTIALQLAMRLASVDRGRVDYFQLEEIKEAMATRALVHGTQHVDRTKIRDLTLGEEDFKDLDKARSMLKNVNLFVEDNEGNAKQICALAKAHKSKFVIVDYLQLMWDNATGQQNESTRLESISRMFIKERNASVNEGNPRTFIIVYQMNEQGKAHGTRTVYKDCDGAIEIMPSEDAEKGEAIEGSIDVHILPGRVWQGGHKISLNFSGAHSLITDGDPILDLKSMTIRDPKAPANIQSEELPL